MFFVLPLRVEEAAFDRRPVVSIGIAAICAVAFVATWLVQWDADRAAPRELQEVTDYYLAHPWLEMPATLTGMLSDSSLRGVANLHSAAEGKAAALDEEQRAKEQEYLDDLCQRFAATFDATPMRRFALVPARGLFQIGWLTHLFLHFGWMHLLGNMLFFYLTAPLLEDAWGRRFFAGFYLLGGLFAGMAQAGIEHGSGTAIAGASGAIAACMGAFSQRFARRKIRMGYFLFAIIRIFRGTFLVPAWLWGAFWFGSEVLSFSNHSSGGVAVMAHIGGFLFGFSISVLLTGFGLQELLKPAAETPLAAPEQRPVREIDRARSALREGDSNAAARAFRNVLISSPDDAEAAAGLARLELKEGDAARGMARLDKLALQLVQAGRPEDAFRALAQAGAEGELARLSPAVVQQLQAARKRAPGSAAAIVAALPAPAAEPAPSARARIIDCRLQAIDAHAVTVEALTGHRRVIALSALAGVGSAVVSPDGGAGGLVLTDLVLRFAGPDGPAAVVRIAGPDLGLNALYPGLPPREGYPRLLSQLLAAPGVVALPDRAALEAGRFPRFADTAALESAFYSRGRPAGAV